MSKFVVRNSEMARVAVGDSLNEVLKRKASIWRIDVWSSAPGFVSVGLAWDDDSSCIGDVSDHEFLMALPGALVPKLVDHREVFVPVCREAASG